MEKSVFQVPEWCACPQEKFVLEVLKGGAIIDDIDLSAKSHFFCGRQRAAVDIPMDHPSISRKHAVIVFRNDGAVMLLDLHSAQGTFLNKSQCHPSNFYRVFVGDIIQFGTSTRRYILNGPENQRPPEHDSENMGKYREKLKERSAEILKKTQKEEEMVGITWGFREDAENPSGDEDINDFRGGGGGGAAPPLPDYMLKHEHFDRIYSSKYEVDIKDAEVTSNKDKEILEKVRKKELKVQHMQEEIKRIYLKEGSQENGLTEGQQAAVARNDTRITQLQEEMEKLVKQIRSNNAKREAQSSVCTEEGEGSFSFSSKKTSRDLMGEEEEILDLTSNTADASTNWRLRKKQKHMSNIQDNCTILNNSSDRVQKALSYEELKGEIDIATESLKILIEKSETLQDKLRRYYEHLQHINIDKNSHNHYVDEIQRIIDRDKAGDMEEALRKISAEKATIESSLQQLKRLLSHATPALASLTAAKEPAVKGSIAPTTQKKINSAQSKEVDKGELPAMRIQLPWLAAGSTTAATTTTMEGVNIEKIESESGAAAGVLSDKNEMNSVAEKPKAPGTISLSSFKMFVQQEKKNMAHEQQLQKINQALGSRMPTALAPTMLTGTQLQVKRIDSEDNGEQVSDVQAKANSESHASKAACIDIKRAYTVGAAPPPSAATLKELAAGEETCTSKSSHENRKVTHNNNNNDYKSSIYESSLSDAGVNFGRSAKILEGGETAWVPPVNQNGDGKTDLNKKLGY